MYRSMTRWCVRANSRVGRHHRVYNRTDAESTNQHEGHNDFHNQVRTMCAAKCPVEEYAVTVPCAC